MALQERRLPGERRQRGDGERRAEQLGVGAHLRWIDRFLDQESLLDLIAAADIYVTPYLELTQITSGTLSYAVALGKPVVSTPYHHAVEIVGPGNGILAAPGEADAFAAAVNRLLGDDALRERMAQNAYARGRAMIWRRNVEATMAEFSACVRAQFVTPRAAAEPAEAFAN